MNKIKDAKVNGEFRKRVQFMFPGKLMKIKFEFYGQSIDAILDRLPSAEILEENDANLVANSTEYRECLKIT
ncbi:hypothetical protein QBE52_15005 [Clostridiaceae bacterium 35-E11]